jgi:2,4-dienoyl-CoA reductase-like NADH-dependent reductase (Old Yellow Enzyme family)
MSASLLFSPYTLPSPNGGLALANRIVIAPMCQYASVGGLANDWHLAHWTNLLNSGAALLTIEATAVTEDGRITNGCLGLWDDATHAALEQHLHRARALAPHMPVCIQLGHAGRKASSAKPWDGGHLLRLDDAGWVTMGPSALPHLPTERAPQAMSVQDIANVQQAFVSAAVRAQAIGFEAIELHAAHGYLLHQFLSPLANQRDDAYGGDFEGRTRMVREVFDAVRAVFKGSLGVRISATDWVDGGWSVEETTRLSALLKAAGCDFVHLSSAGVSPLQKIAIGPGYQLPFAKAVKDATGMSTMGVGLITEPQLAEDALQRGDADLIAIARALLFNPRWPWAAAAQLGGQVVGKTCYLRSQPLHAKHIFSNQGGGQR